MARARWLVWLSGPLFALVFWLGYQDGPRPRPASALICGALILLACATPIMIPSRGVRIWAFLNSLLGSACACGVWDHATNTSSYAGYAAIVFVPLATLTFLSIVGCTILAARRTH